MSEIFVLKNASKCLQVYVLKKKRKGKGMVIVIDGEAGKS